MQSALGMVAMIAELFITWLRILAGLSLIVLGRKIFWLFIGAVGFGSGMEIASRLFHGRSGWMVLLLALAFGLLGILLAFLLQRIAVGLAGFIAGGYCLYHFLLFMGWEPIRYGWVFIVLASFLGAVMANTLFNWALIFLSSLVGAILVVQTIHFEPPIPAILFGLLFVAGIGTQAVLTYRRSGDSAY